MLRLTHSHAARAAEYNAREYAAGRLKVPAALRVVLITLNAFERFASSGPARTYEELLGDPEGAQVVAELQRAVGVPGDGMWGPKSAQAYAAALLRRAEYTVRGSHPVCVRPHTEELLRACDEACQWLPRAPLTDEEFGALSNIIDRESDGWRARPNYTADKVAWYIDARYDVDHRYSAPENRDVWDVFATDVRNHRYRSKSSAVGIGQLLGSNYDLHGPMGRGSIGDTVAELAAMISYCDGRYGGPVPAWEFYELDECPEDRKSYYSERALEIGCKPGEGY